MGGCLVWAGRGEVQGKPTCDLDFERPKAPPGAHTSAKGPQIIKKATDHVQSAGLQKQIKVRKKYVAKLDL